ncbi:MAG TPA: ATP-grasp domain-containing protein [Roseiflexaceae bacterium]|nr:ATP-grasp domain-containing protein [Roseiflexaceae bacterium]HMP40491.1 ATP-grasp domain-containing protein [Roseiflexaceae bacterium]
MTFRHRRVLLLTAPQSYRAEAFLAAATQLDIDAVVAVDMDVSLADHWQYPLGFRFDDPDQALAAIGAYAAANPLDAIIAVDDTGTLLAAQASAALGLPHNAPDAAEAARDKYLMRRRLAAGGVPIPAFRLCSTSDDYALLASEIRFPCVVKPLRLNGSRGVIRADNRQQFVSAACRLADLLDMIEPGPQPKPFLAEDFVPGVEVALEGMIDDGIVQVLALFDKPDPLDGPFFEETLYVTPSRLPPELQAAIGACAAAAAAALGLRRGPIHAELRVNEQGPWLIEAAGRSIGGMCSRTLQFGSSASLEELILRQACALPIESLSRSGHAGGVMMIPIPHGGILRRVAGIAEALRVTGVEDVQITAPLHYPITPLPEGDSYLGFIFARGETPAAVEAALREAHACLNFTIEAAIPLALA